MDRGSFRRRGKEASLHNHSGDCWGLCLFVCLLAETLIVQMPVLCNNMKKRERFSLIDVKVEQQSDHMTWKAPVTTSAYTSSGTSFLLAAFY